jgi:anti-sigma factor RsiW
MNPSANDPGEQATDKLLFQYLEGELTDEQIRTLEARLTADPALRSELELWQATVVTPDEYDTTALEGRLLKEPAPSLGDSLFRWVPDLLLVAALLLAIPLLKAPAPTTAETHPHRPPAVRKAERFPAGTSAAKQPVNKPDPAPQAVRAQPGGFATDHAVPAGRLPHPARGEKGEAVPSLAAPGLMAAVDPLEPVNTLQAVPAPEGTGIGYVREQPVKKMKVTAPRTLTRQQQRAIARMKRRAIQQRKANEFLKGNIPYVVPLDPNSF